MEVDRVGLRLLAVRAFLSGGLRVIEIRNDAVDLTFAEFRQLVLEVGVVGYRQLLRRAGVEFAVVCFGQGADRRCGRLRKLVFQQIEIRVILARRRTAGGVDVVAALDTLNVLRADYGVCVADRRRSTLLRENGALQQQSEREGHETRGAPDGGAAGR